MTEVGCLLSDCTFTRDGSCVVHGATCPDCHCSSALHPEPERAPALDDELVRHVRLVLLSALFDPLPCPRCGSLARCRCSVPAEERRLQRVEYVVDALRLLFGGASCTTGA